LKADDFREAVYALDNAVPSELQYEFLMELEEVIAYGLKWFLKHQPEERISFDFILQYREVVSECRDAMWNCILDIIDREKLERLETRIKELEAEKVPEALARKYVTLPFMKDVMDIIRIKEAHHYDFNETAKLYLKVSDYFNIDWLVESLTKMKVSDRWGIENVDHLMHELKDCLDDIVVSILNFKRKGEDLMQAFDNFLRENSEEAAVYRQSMEELLEEGKAGIISTNVIVRKLSSFIYHHE
jgi:NAD-specific glutamate dehydrogenase